MKKLICLILIGAGIVIMLHHFWKHRKFFNREDLASHEFVAGICISVGLGGLLLG